MTETGMATDSAQACMVSIEVDGRQRYLFETDKWQEMLGASSIIEQTRDCAKDWFKERDGLVLLQPVSGEIRAWAPIDKRRALLDAAWKLRDWLAVRGIEHTCGYLEADRRHFEKNDEPPLPPTVDGSLPQVSPDRASLADVQKKMTRFVTVSKVAKVGTDARPVCSLFAPCRLHGFDFANEWRPFKRPDEPDEPRRRQRGFRAEFKQKAWHDAKKRLYDDEIKGPLEKALRRENIPDPARVLQQLEARFDYSQHLDEAGQQQQDRYIAFLCADGDGFGTQLLPSLDWNSVSWGDKELAWKRNALFVEALDGCVRVAFRNALVEVTVETLGKQMAADNGRREPPYIPVLLQLLGGDDLWMLARRDVALDLAYRFSKGFETLAIDDSVLQTAVRVANENGAGIDRLTISVGVAFAKSGYPIHAMADAAESLLAEAKYLRKGEIWGRGSAGEGCLDWHWIQSSLSEPVRDARNDGWRYHDREEGISTLLLTTRPWTIEQVKQFIEAKRKFDELARRKRQQLEDVLRRGYTLSLLAWEGWWKSLTAEERTAMREVRALLKSAGCDLPKPSGREWDVAFLPWERVKPGEMPAMYRTPWLDLLALDDVLRGDNQSESRDDPDVVEG